MVGGFGTLVREMRKEKRIGLREFCQKAQVDPSNWSKVERGVLPPPTDAAAIDRIAEALGVQRGSNEWHQLSDAAFADRGLIPEDIMSDEKLVAKLPMFFRTLRGEKPTAEELRELAEILRHS